MNASVVLISPKFQVVLPKIVREALSLKPKEKLIVMEVDGQIIMVPAENIKDLRGTLKGVTTDGLRDENDRF